MDAKLAKVYYSPQGYWKGIAAVEKLADSAKAPQETAKQWLIKQALCRSISPRRATFLVPNSTYRRLTRSTKWTFFFCLTTSFHVGVKFTNTR